MLKGYTIKQKETQKFSQVQTTESSDYFHM